MALRKGQQVRSARPLRNGQMSLAKGTFGIVLGVRGLFSPRYLVDFVANGVTMRVPGLTDRDLVIVAPPRLGR